MKLITLALVFLTLTSFSSYAQTGPLFVCTGDSFHFELDDSGSTSSSKATLSYDGGPALTMSCMELLGEGAQFLWVCEGKMSEEETLFVTLFSEESAREFMATVGLKVTPSSDVRQLSTLKCARQ